ncbi:MAG: multidrug transporter AcrB [Phycisphaeraceae bacterium]|nr:MAG: multidrug transporter AcrB [Phycisphaeraceae bacterium]
MSLARFGVRHPVVANLVMFALIGAGLMFGVSLRREFFPAVNPTFIVVSAPYPGAAPEEIEDALAVKIEDTLTDIDGVKEISTTAAEGFATVMVEFKSGTNIDRALADVKREVDALQDLPDAAERITVDMLEPNLPAISLSLYGDADERTRKLFMQGVRDDLETIPGMGDIAPGGVRTDEIAVEVRPGALLEHGLSVTDVSERIRAAMTELPAGSVRGSTSTIAIRTVGLDETAETVRRIVVKAEGDGTVVRVGEVAEVSEGFVDTDLRVRLNGEPTVNLTVFKVGKDDIIEMSELVKAYVAGRNGEAIELKLGEEIAGFMRPPDDTSPVSHRTAAWELGYTRWLEGPPPGTLVTTTDLARFVKGRLDLLTRNALWGGALVFVILVLLLSWRVSFWVAAGLIVSLLGTLAFMHFAGVTLNLLTMFGLIVVIGILVDDAIVVAENIQARHEMGESPKVAAVRGTDKVAWPVVATVLTTICAFLPLALIEGSLGDFLFWIPVVVACALLVSLVETLFILPSHMAHSLRAHDDAVKPGRGGIMRAIERVEARFDAGRDRVFNGWIIPWYLRLLAKAIEYRYVAAAVAIGAVIVSVGLVAGDKVRFILMESDDAETVNITLAMSVGTPAERTDEVMRRIETAAMNQPEVASAFAQTGAVASMDGTTIGSSAGHVGQVVLELTPAESRERKSDVVIQSIRDEVGEIAGVKSLRMQGISGGPEGPALSFTFVGTDPARLDEAVERLKAFMDNYPAIHSIADDADRGQRELRIELRDGASELGFTQASVGRQVQGAVFGLEAFTFAGDREDVDVRVMMPESVRRNLHALEQMNVFAPDGTPVPLSEVARLVEARTNATIRRLDGERAVAVTADVVVGPGMPNADELAQREIKPFLAGLEREIPGVRVVERGRQQDFADSMRTLPIGMMVAAGLIYIVLAWLFGSFTQPLVVMAAIPFATVGMIWGHFLLGYSLTFLSLIGFVALSGIVVNDSLIFMEFFNEERAKGLAVPEAAYRAGRARVRAIILTTVTTVFGLLPLMLEQSFQAKFLIPMAITIACGLMSATLVILVVLPCLLQILDDIVHALRVLWTGDPRIAHKNPRVRDDELAALDAAG